MASGVGDAESIGYDAFWTVNDAFWTVNAAFCTTMLGDALGDGVPVDEAVGLDDVGARDKADVGLAEGEVVDELGVVDAAVADGLVDDVGVLLAVGLMTADGAG